MNKLIIADTYLHYDLECDLLNTEGTDTVANFDVLSPLSYYTKYANSHYLSEMEALCEINQLLKKNSSEIFKELLYTAGFQKELYRILEELKKNGCTVDELPTDTAIRIELRRILTTLEHLNISANIYHDAYENIKDVDDFSNATFINYNPTSYYEKCIVKHMCKHGASNIKKTTEVTNTTYHYALNIRQEIENVALQICELLKVTSFNDIQILVPDNSYIPYISFVFSRYNIPYYSTLVKESCTVENNIKALLTFLKSKSMEDLLTFIFSPLLKVSYKNELSSYIKAFEITYEELFIPFSKVSLINFNKEIFNNFNKKELMYLEEKALLAQNDLLPILASLHFDTLYSFVMSVYNLYHTNEYLSDNDKRYLSTFKSHLVPLKKALLSFSFNDGLLYLEKELESIALPLTRYNNVVRISTYTKSYYNCNHTFVVGAHQKNYPNFTSLSGLFDEALVANLMNYPTIDERYASHLEVLKNHLSVSKNLYIMYPESGFDGKARESSLELELAFNISKPTYKELIENDIYYYPEHQIADELGKELLLPNNKIRGSITSIERYFKCPYQYFLKSGLHIKDLNNLTINETAFGSLQHKFFEDMINEYAKEYVNIDEAMIDTFLNDEFTAYLNLYPKKQTSVQVMKDITKRNILKSLSTLKDMEEHTRFIPKAVEYEFDTTYLEHNGITLQLRGKIDRYDTNYNGYRIIDYKSSEHSFSQGKFRSGTLLQLLTYASIIKQAHPDKVPYGMYYFSFANKTCDDEPYKIGRRKQVIIEEQETINTNNLLNGYTFTKEEIELNNLDDNGEHIKSLSINKDGSIKNSTRNYVTYEELIEDLNDIYRYFIDSLLSNNISCSPILGACTYCNYNRICGFKGREAKEKPLPIFNEIEKEGDDNA